MTSYLFSGVKITNLQGLQLCELTVRLHCGCGIFHTAMICNDHGIGSDVGLWVRLRWSRWDNTRPRRLKQNYGSKFIHITDHRDRKSCIASNLVISNGALEIRLVTLRASCSAVYCNLSCLFVCGWVCYHDNSKLRASILTKLGF